MALEVNQGMYVLADVGSVSYPARSAVAVLQTVTQNGRTAGHLYVYAGSGNWTDITGNGTGGSVSSFSSGNLAPLFTTAVATASTTPALSFALSNAAANTVLGNATGSSAAPSYGQIVAGQIASNAVTTAKILDANVTLAKIANAAANSKVLGSGAAGVGAAYAELTLGTNLSITGTTLNGPSGFSGTVPNPTSITVVDGIVTAVS